MSLFLLLIAVVVVYLEWLEPTWSLAVPVSFLAVNLAAAILRNRSFRSNVPLLLFHLSLLAIMLLVVVGRMTYLQGWVRVAEQSRFDGTLAGYAAGPWHPWRIESAAFTNEEFEIRYLPLAGLDFPVVAETRNLVSWRDRGGQRQIKLIGDNEPLVRYGYAFYTSSINKGYAPIIRWTPSGSQREGEALAMHLPSYPEFEFQQAFEWALPGLQTPLWMMLEFDEEILARDRPSSLRVPLQHRLIVRFGQDRHELSAGSTVLLPEGELEYLGLRRWLGYDVRWDVTTPWLLASCAIAVATLGWHFTRRFRGSSWLQTDQTVEAGLRREST